MRRRPDAILAIFILSGSAGLIYEIVWSRQLVLVFGNTTQAVSAILTGFFGGMAIGAWVGGRVADRVRSPLRLYAFLELALVVVVLLTPISFRLIGDAYRGIYPSLESAPGPLVLLRLALALLALGPATVLMGATFPSLTRHLTRTEALRAAFGQLYAANTLGAIAGTLLSGLVLIELLGLSGALLVGAACSGIAGLAALALSRGDAIPTPKATPSLDASRPASTTAPGSTPRVRLALAIAFISGVTSLAYQVTWTRLLASGTGNTTYVFTIILALFLVGLAIGATIFNAIGPRLKDPVRVLAITQALVGVLALWGLVVVISHAPHPDPGQPLGALRALIGQAIPVVLPVTIVLGVAYPTASALLRDAVAEAGTESGALLAVNTVGAILGSFAVPFVLMPVIGSPAIVVLLAAVNGAVALALALWATPIRRWISAAVGAGVLAMVLVTIVRPGMVRQPNEAWIESVGGHLFASSEDEIASVQAGQVSSTPELWVAGTSMTLLTVDAKLMPVLPLIARPQSQRALVVAFGMGTAFRASLIAGLRTDVVELVPSVPKMFQYYYPDAASVLANPNGRVIVTDGRNHLELTDERFDIILTDPPPPIESSGAAVISSQEYFQSGHDHLTPGGVMMQWVPFGNQGDDVNDQMRTFASVFPHVTVVRGPGGYGAYMLGSDDPITLPDDQIQAILARPGVLADISSAYDSPAHDLSTWLAVIHRQLWLSDDALRAEVGPGPIVTDDRPRTEYFLLRRLTNGALP